MFIDGLRELTKNSQEERKTNIVEREVELVKERAEKAARSGENFTWVKIGHCLDAVLPELENLGFKMRREGEWVFLEWS